MVVIKKFVFNPFFENSYILWDESSKEAAVIDPGCSNKAEEDELRSYIEDTELQVKYLINTHCHIDHILGIKYVKDKYNVQFYAPEADIPLLIHADKQAEAFGIEIEKPPLPDVYLTEFTHMNLGSAPLQLLFTPGHSPGEYCIYLEKEKLCVTGDVLFRRSIGRTDLWGGDFNQLIHSIKTKLFTLPDEVKIYPGHGESSTIGEEKSGNPFIA
jgi:hydroxyacylglutathione hydrolase